MGTFFIVVLVILMISAPWISRKWGKYGEIAWGIIAMFVLILALLILE